MCVCVWCGVNRNIYQDFIVTTHYYVVFCHLMIHDFNPLSAELNPICHLLALLGGATIVVVSRLRVKDDTLSVSFKDPVRTAQ